MLAEGIFSLFWLDLRLLIVFICTFFIPWRWLPENSILVSTFSSPVLWLNCFWSFREGICHRTVTHILYFLFLYVIVGFPWNSNSILRFMIIFLRIQLIPSFNGFLTSFHFWWLWILWYLLLCFSTESLKQFSTFCWFWLLLFFSFFYWFSLLSFSLQFLNFSFLELLQIFIWIWLHHNVKSNILLIFLS